MGFPPCSPHSQTKPPRECPIQAKHRPGQETLAWWWYQRLPGTSNIGLQPGRGALLQRHHALYYIRGPRGGGGGGTPFLETSRQEMSGPQQRPLPLTTLTYTQSNDNPHAHTHNPLQLLHWSLITQGAIVCVLGARTIGWINAVASVLQSRKMRQRHVAPCSQLSQSATGPAFAIQQNLTTMQPGGVRIRLYAPSMAKVWKSGNCL